MVASRRAAEELIREGHVSVDGRVVTEMGVSVDPATSKVKVDGRPVLSPLAWPLAYRWPVHRLSAGFQPAEPPAAPTFIVVHRDADGRIGFLQVDAPTARLLELMDSGEGLAGADLLSRVAAELAGGNAQELLEQGRHTLSTLRGRGIVMGTARETETNR